MNWQLNSTISEEGVDIFYHADIIARSNFLLRAVWRSALPFQELLGRPQLLFSNIALPKN